MSFKDKIVSAIKEVADTKGTLNTVSNIGSSGKAWLADPQDSTKEQSLSIMVEGLANAIIARSFPLYAPFNGVLQKTITGFFSPHSIILTNTDGLRVGDSFSVVGSSYNNGGKNIVSISGDTITVSQDVATETSVTIGIVIGPPNTDLNIENSINRLQASIGDTIPKTATTTKRGLIKQGVNVEEMLSPLTPAELKLNEIIVELKNAGILNNF